MTKKFDDSALAEAMGAARVELVIDRDYGIRMLGIFYTEVQAGRVPPDECMQFVAGGLASYFDSGSKGELARDHYKIVKPKSHETPARVWARMRLISDERQPRRRRRKSNPRERRKRI